MNDDYKISGSAGEAKDLARQDQLRRNRAKSKILKPSEVRGQFDAHRMLMTTLGGEKREITTEDLAVFRQNAQIAGRNFIGGITARQVIDLSLSIDRERARKEISWAVPSYAQKNVKGNLFVRFVTDASQKYDATRHHVTVEFLGYQTAIISGAHEPLRASRLMAKQQIKFDCDCGRHTFWYRYISTIGNFNSGRQETGYPKIRNPHLNGVACKHVLRVMAELEGNSSVLNFLKTAIEKGRKKATARTVAKQEDATEEIKKQSKRATHRLDDREQRDLHRSRLALRKTVAKARKDMQKPKVNASGSRKIGNLAKMGKNKQARSLLENAIKGMGLTVEQAMALLTAKK